MSDCLFCKIAGGEIPSKKVYEDDQVYAFYDIDPQAPTHFLVIPKAHIKSCGAITPENSAVVAHCFEVISKITQEQGITDFRVVSNCREQGGQAQRHHAGTGRQDRPFLFDRSQEIQQHKPIDEQGPHRVIAPVHLHRR